MMFVLHHDFPLTVSQFSLISKQLKRRDLLYSEVKLFTCCLLLVIFFSLLVTFCLLLAYFCFLLVTFCSLLVTFCSLLVKFCPLLVTFCSLLVTFYALFEKKFWMTFLSKSTIKKFSTLICTKSLICDNLKTRIVLNWRFSAIFMGTKDKIAGKFSIQSCCSF